MDPVVAVGEGASPPPEVPAEALAGIKELCAEAEERLFYRSESGLFDVKVTISRAEIAATIRRARDHADAGRLNEAHEALMEAYGKLHDAIKQRGRLWSSIHVHTVHLYAYYLLLIVVFIWVGVSTNVSFRALAGAELWSIPVAMAAYGMLGGLVRGLFWLPQKVESRSFRVQFTMVYLIAPWLAMMLGMVAYVLLDAGMLVLGDVADSGLQDSGPPAGGAPDSTTGPDAGGGARASTPAEVDSGTPTGKAEKLAPGFIAVAIFAGFSWEWITERINSRLGQS